MTRKTRDEPRPSLGGWVCSWIEKFLVHSEGDWFGKPFRLIDFHRKFIWRAYELLPDGTRAYDRALLGMPKGNAKTEIAAAISLCELAGPVEFTGWDSSGQPVGKPRMSPDIPVAAASFEQANLLFGAARTMVEQGPLAPFFECWETEIRPKEGPGRLYRVAAAAGTNDGKKPTFFAADELHEWEGRKERVHLILSNGIAKRAGAWELNISTAGWDPASLLGRMCAEGDRILSGEEPEGRFLYEWCRPEKIVDRKTGETREFDSSNPVELEAAIRQSNPAIGHFLDFDRVLDKFKKVPEHEGRRYFTNQWTESPERWLPEGTWESLPQSRSVPEGTPIAIGFDGSYSGDSTAMVGCTLDGNPHIFVIQAWEKPDATAYDWRVDVLDVEETFRQACAKWNVLVAGCDPYRWQRTMGVLSEEGYPIVEWGSHSPSRMVPACSDFYEAATTGGFTHDGDPRLAKHVANCRIKTDARGPRIVKDHKDSPRKIDLAVAAVIAHDLMIRNPAPQASMYANADTAVL